MLCETEHRRANGGAIEVLISDEREPEQSKPQPKAAPKNSGEIGSPFGCAGGLDLHLVLEVKRAQLPRKEVKRMAEGF